jgi:His-Xaa-Ser system radical SAM maturase HxsB
MATILPQKDFAGSDRNYSLLPFRFDRWANGDYLVINEVGEHHILSQQDFRQFVGHQLALENPAYAQLRTRHFLTDKNSSALFDVLAAKYRTRKSFLDGSAKLHIFVVTQRCDQACQYCQVTRQSEKECSFDMTEEVLHHSVDLVMANPSQCVTMEFQGGEPLLNFDLVKEAVLYSKEQNKTQCKDIEYVICTNLVQLEDKHIDFFKEHNVQVSSSLDGPDYIHDKHRLCNGQGSHARVTHNIHRAQEALGYDAVSCLMTTTKTSLKYPREIVDEYLKFNLGSMFIRDLNPYGYALKTDSVIGYTTEEFLAFYREVLSYIIQIDREGRTFSESFAGLILSKILSPWPVGFVDLQSPTGAGFGVVVYHYDGDVYASDESRMLAEMGVRKFRMGNVLEDSYDEIFFGDTMQTIALAACNESLPGCSDCAYQSYCGSEPVRNFSTQGDIIGHRPTSSFCRRNKSVIKHVLKTYLEADSDLEHILWAWINRESVDNMKLPRPEWLLQS